MPAATNTRHVLARERESAQLPVKECHDERPFLSDGLKTVDGSEQPRRTQGIRQREVARDER
jgi:hypothetical protein